MADEQNQETTEDESQVIDAEVVEKTESSESEKEKSEKSDSQTEEKKNSAKNVGRTILNYIDKGVVAGKKGLKSAGNAISDFGDKSVLRIELQQLKGKKNTALGELGKITYKTFLGEEKTLSAENEEIKKIMSELKDLDSNIKKHEDALKKTNPEA